MNMAKKITIPDWVAHNYAGSGAPNERTVLRWIKAGLMYPPATRDGKRYYLQSDAQVVNKTSTLLDRMKVKYGQVGRAA